MGMETMSLWVQFQALPTLSPAEESLHRAYIGVFVCQSDRPDALHFLDEILAKKNLARGETGEISRRSTQDNWGLFERLKEPLQSQTYALHLTEMERNPDIPTLERQIEKIDSQNKRKSQPPDFSN